MVSRWSGNTALSSRLRKTLVAVAIGLSAAALIALSQVPAVKGFLGDLMLELGAGLLLVLIAGLWLDRFLREYRIGATHEHKNMPFEVLIGNIARSKKETKILTTWTGLLEPNHRDSCLQAFRSALDSGADIKILLADPDSSASEQRTREADSLFDTQQKTMENLKVLHDFQQEYFGGRHSAQLDVRLYSVTPGVQMYGWDDKAYVSFYPIGQITYDSSKLETFLSTPLGAFVSQRFEELWDGSYRTVDHYMRSTVTVRDSDGLHESCEVRYVRHGADYYVGGADLEMWSRRSGVEVGVVFVSCDGTLRPSHDRKRDYDLKEVGGLRPGAVTEQRLSEIQALYRTKYDESRDVVLFQLVPR